MMVVYLSSHIIRVCIHFIYLVVEFFFLIGIFIIQRALLCASMDHVHGEVVLVNMDGLALIAILVCFSFSIQKFLILLCL